MCRRVVDSTLLLPSVGPTRDWHVTFGASAGSADSLLVPFVFLYLVSSSYTGCAVTSTTSSYAKCSTSGISRPLKVIHANLGKSGTAQYSLLNDEDLSDFSLIFISEPSCFYRPSGETVVASITYLYWKQLVPTISRHGRYPVRLML